MHEETIISGFGGQGALFAGQLLAYAGMDNGKYVTWIPSYGPEMRGGTAHCTVVISDEPIGSPMVRHPSAALTLNLPSMEKYQPLVKAGGLLLYNSSLVQSQATRADIRAVGVPANAISQEETAVLLGTHGDARLANVSMLGALIEATGLLTLEHLENALAAHLPERHRRWLGPNGLALRRGAAIAAEALGAGVPTS